MSTLHRPLSRIRLRSSLLRATTPPQPAHTPLNPRTQLRHESTARRHKKLLALPESPSFTPDRASPTIIFNPPSSAPSVYHTPLKFLPKTDARRALYAKHAETSARAALTSRVPNVAVPGTPLHTLATAFRAAHANATATGQSASSTSTSSSAPASLSTAHLPPRPSAALPPALRGPYEKKYHLSPEDIAEMARLRAEDPDTWTRARLAEKFGCSQVFVGMVAKNKEKAERVRREHEAARRKWGKKRVMAREDRERRRALWGRDL